MTPKDRFSCREVVRRLDDYVDRELDPEEQRLVEAHLQECAQCASEYRFEANLLRQVRDKVRRIDVPSDLMAKVLKRIAEDTGEE